MWRMCCLRGHACDCRELGATANWDMKSDMRTIACLITLAVALTAACGGAPPPTDVTFTPVTFVPATTGVPTPATIPTAPSISVIDADTVTRAMEAQSSVKVHEVLRNGSTNTFRVDRPGRVWVEYARPTSLERWLVIGRSIWHAVGTSVDNVGPWQTSTISPGIEASVLAPWGGISVIEGGLRGAKPVSEADRLCDPMVCQLLRTGTKGFNSVTYYVDRRTALLMRATVDGPAGAFDDVVEWSDYGVSNDLKPPGP